MKKVEIIIKPERLEELKIVLQECGITGLMISNVMGYGNQKGFTAQYRGTTYTVNLLPKIRVQTVTSDTIAENIVKAVCSKLAKGDVGDGKIFLYDVADVIRIRTGERGEKAL
ncbi:MAG: P-II family nitrogen regulator [Firmicutes bacterium]|nr:P-II family nitrogen regulator [Bacillota bacterium]